MRDDNEELELFRRYAATRDRAVRNDLVERHMGLAAHVARRFGRAGSRDDDLRQVAMVGLVKAVDRFDPSLGHPFVAFAGSTIEGELKRHFRDTSWAARVPRAAKELHLLVRNAADELQHRDGRSPTVDELANHLRIERDDVLRGFAAAAAYQASALDSGTDDDATQDRRGALAQPEGAYDAVLDAHMVSGLMRRLAPREREIVRLRFYEQRSQSEIADAVGLSQMHVSRLLRRAFEQMRGWLAANAGHDELGG